MNARYTRRSFSRTSIATGGLLLGNILPVSFTNAAELPQSEPVRFRTEIEPLVQLIENTGRQQLLEEIGHKVKNGLGYQQLLAALFLAGIRNVQPRPSVGFKFHAVLVVNSAHLASLASTGSDRWLPIFWALDEFKSSQARDTREGNWTMPAVDEGSVPSADKSVELFNQAMLNWDESLADVAAAGVARSLGATDVLDLYAAYAARDFRSIGHKAIYLANAWRTLQTIGWRFSEPVLRSLAYAMLNHNGEPNPSTSDLSPDRPWRENQKLAKSVRKSWISGKVDSKASSELIETLRNQNERAAANLVVSQLNAGVSPQSIWDAMHTAAGELSMRQAGIVALHAVTTSNANRFLFDHVGDMQTRLMLLLQNASFIPLFREAMGGRGKVGSRQIDQLAVAPSNVKSGEAITSIFTDAASDRMQAANGIFSYLEAGNDAESLVASARRLIFAKGNDSHDYKFSSAALEDYYKISPAWRNQFLATSIYQWKTAADKDNGLVQRIQAALS